MSKDKQHLKTLAELREAEKRIEKLERERDAARLTLRRVSTLVNEALAECDRPAIPTLTIDEVVGGWSDK